MSLQSRYNFKEASLGKDLPAGRQGFAKERVAAFMEFIEEGRSFTVISMPGVGVSYFLRYLAMQDLPAGRQGFAQFFHIDLYSLPSLNQHEFYKLLLTALGGKAGSKTDQQILTSSKEILTSLSEKKDKIVLILSRFDQLKKEFNNQFLSNIQSLTTLNVGKIVLIFTSIKPIPEISADTLSGGNLNFYSESLYFPPYSKADLQKLITIEPIRTTPKEVLDQLLDLSGGHNQLLQILRRSQKQQNLLLDQFVKLQLKGLIDYLDYQQRKTLQKIALGKTIDDVDEYLLGVGLVKKVQSTSEVKKMQLHSGGVEYELFTPLLSEYIKQNLPIKLPVKEAKLFKLLRNKLGQLVTKDEIFTEVWGEGDGGATNWALDALIYRLRKHPFIKSHGYIIESHKKVGYTLIQT